MKSLNFSLNALVALCCLMLFATSCQDDVLESESASALPEETPQQAELKQLLTEVTKQLPSLSDLRHARMAQGETFVYKLSLDLFTVEGFAAVRGELLEEQTGTLTLTEVDSIADFNVIAPGRDITLYMGTYAFSTADGVNDTVRAFAISLSDGNGALLLEASLDGTSLDGNLYISDFALGEDFANTRSPLGALVRSEALDDIFVADYEATFVGIENEEPETPTMPEDTFSYRLQLELFNSDPEAEQPDLGIRNLVDRISGTLILSPAAAPLEGDLDVDPSVSLEGDPIFTGIFEFTDEDGNLQTRPVSAAVDLETGIGYLDVNNVLGTEDVGEVVIATPTFRPDLMFEGISFAGLTTATTTGNPDLPEVVVVKVNGQLNREPSSSDIAASYTYDLSVAIDRAEGQGQLTELTGRLDVTLFVDGSAGARYFFTTLDSIPSATGLEGGLTDDGTLTLATFSSTNDGVDADFLPEPGLSKLVITDLPTLDNREATSSVMAFDVTGDPLGAVTVDATITSVVVDEEEVDL